jgi:glycerol-3-phosphate cytidylyltransferase-like family protein
VDTRNKILNHDVALRVARQIRNSEGRLRVVTGYFDPVVAAHARRLAELATANTTLMAVVVSHPNCLMDDRSRAEMLAALRVVDYVVLPGNLGISELLDRMEPDALCREEEADERRTAELTSRIRERQKLGAEG